MTTPPSDPTPGQDPQQPAGEDAPRYGVRLPGYGQNGAPAAQGPTPVPGNNERPGWDASPRDAAQAPQAPQYGQGQFGQVPPAQQYGQPGPYGQQAQGGYTLPPAPADPYAQGIPVQPSGVYGNYQQPGFGAPAGQVPPRPSTVRWASLLLAIGAVAYLIMSAVQMMTMDAATLREAALAAVPADMQDEYASLLTEEMINSTKVTAVIVVAIASALAGLVAWLTYRGQNAWRIVGTVCGALAVVGNLTAGPIGLLFSALAVAVIVLWWMRPSSQWFGAIAQAKRQGQRF